MKRYTLFLEYFLLNVFNDLLCLFILNVKTFYIGWHNVILRETHFKLLKLYFNNYNLFKF